MLICAVAAHGINRAVYPALIPTTGKKVSLFFKRKMGEGHF